MLWRLDEFALLLASIAGFLVVMELGFRLGVRHRGLSDDSDRIHVGSLQAAVLGLLALLLGFTFFLAVSRFDARRTLVLDEANAIGTTYLRAKFLPTEQIDTAQGLLREYVSSRLSFYAAGIDPGKLGKANNESARIERQLWALAVEVAEQNPRSVPVGLFIESLNDVIDIKEKRQVALDSHVPELVLYLLVAVALVSLGLVGYGCGLTRSRRIVINSLFALLIVMVLTAILDMDRPRRGLIKVSQESMIRLQATLKRDAK